MTFDPNEWIPNFTLFILVLAPVILLILFGAIFISRYVNLRSKKVRVKKKWSELLGYIPAFYILFPIWEIVEYLMGERETILDRLFGVHFPVIMVIIIIVGIGQVIVSAFEPLKTG